MIMWNFIEILYLISLFGDTDPIGTFKRQLILIHEFAFLNSGKFNKKSLDSLPYTGRKVTSFQETSGQIPLCETILATRSTGTLCHGKSSMNRGLRPRAKI